MTSADDRSIGDPVQWRHVADVLATELRRWGWGDFHYGDQGQERSVLDALAVYEEAVEKVEAARYLIEQMTAAQNASSTESTGGEKSD